MTCSISRRALCVLSLTALATTFGIAQAPAPAAPSVAVPGDWPATGANAQRDGWLRGDPYLSKESVASSEFALQWKLAPDVPRGRETRVTGWAAAGGRKPITFLADSGGAVRSIDNDTGTPYWVRQFDVPATGSANCGGGITSGVVKVMALTPATTGAAKGGGFGAAVRPAYRGVIGQPGEGIATELTGGTARRGGGPAAGAAPSPGGAPTPPARTAGGAPGPAAGAPTPGRGAAGNDAVAPARAGGAGTGGGRGGGRGGPAGVFAVAPDGVLHVLGENSGIDTQKPVAFLKANAKASGLSLVGNVAYAATSGSCGGVANGLWAVDLAGDQKTVTSWESKGGAAIGAPAFSADGTLYLSIGAAPTGAAGIGNAVVALEPITLTLKDSFVLSSSTLASSPIVIRQGGREIVAVATRDGRVLMLDAQSLGGADHKTPLLMTRGHSSGASYVPAGLASWQDGTGATWLFMPVAGRPATATGLTTTNGVVTSGAIVAFKVADTAGTLDLRATWISRNMLAPWAPIIANGVLFALSTGAAQPLSGAVLYALDPETGRSIWDSGRTMSRPAGRGDLLVGNSQVHVVTSDSVVYAFGLPMERH